jgi:regulator of sigma E protease
MFMLLVILHELGHFIACKLTGVKVTEFGIGIPPKLFTLFKDKSGTEYTLNALPFGGFVAPKGENPHDPDSFKDKNTFMKASLFSKIIILIAGVTMNVILARLLFSFAFWHGVKPIAIMSDNLGYDNVQSYLIPRVDYLIENNLIDPTIKDARVLVTATIP